MGGSAVSIVTWTDVMLAVTSVVTALILLAAAIFAAVQVLQARKLRREQIRPFVIVDIDAVFGVVFELVVTNIGVTIARNVQFEFDPPLQTTLDDQGQPLRDWHILKNGLESLPPSRLYRMLMDRGPDRAESDLPDRYDVILTYLGPDKRPYKDHQVIDFAIWWGKEEMTQRTTHDIWRAMEKMEKSLHDIHSAIVNLAPPSDERFPPIPKPPQRPGSVQENPKRFDS